MRGRHRWLLERLTLALAIVGTLGVVACIFFIPRNHTHRVRALVILWITIPSLVSGGFLGLALLYTEPW